MQNVIEARSSFMSIFSRSLFKLFGIASNEVMKELLDNKKLMESKPPVGFWNIITPWKISVDTTNKRITVTKRNWYLIGVQEDTYAFRSVRHVTVRNFVFGADLGIRLFAGFAVVYSIPKSKAKQIKEILLNTDWNLHDADVVVDVESSNHL